MPGPNWPYSQLSANQVITQVFDEENDRLRTNTEVNATIVGDVTVEISAADGDNIAIANQDGSKSVDVETFNTKNALDINLINTFQYALRLDDTSTSNVTYIGKSIPGTSNASAVWQIQKMDETTGIVITWADGNSNFDNIWNNRTSLSYS